MSCKQLRGDLNYAWPSAEIAVMGAAGAVAVLYGKEAKAAEDPKAFLAEKEKEYDDLFTNPYQAAKYGYIDDVIESPATHVSASYSALGTAQDQEAVESRKEARQHSTLGILSGKNPNPAPFPACRIRGHGRSQQIIHNL
jgi:acetyl-CoA carboxylase carboxyltransferase component